MTRWFGQNPSWLGLVAISGLFIWVVVHFWFTRHEAAGEGAAACAATNHDAAWCASAADENGEECLTLTLDVGSSSRFVDRRGRGLDRSAYMACLELGPNAWSRARAAAKKAARDAVARDQKP